MKFDGNQAWRQAAALISTNRDMLIALAGVFFLLPSLAINLFLPQPTPVAGATPQQLLALTVAWYSRALPFVLAMVLLQALGILAILILLADPRRPTVGVAIRQALAGILSYIAAQLLVGIGIGIVATLLAFIAGLLVAAAPPMTIALVKLVFFAIVIVLFVYGFVRFSLSAPVVAIEGVRNPIAALGRSWRLTRGTVARLFAFYILLGLVFSVVFYAVVALTGIIAALALAPQNAAIVSTVISSALIAASTVLFVALLGTAHRQLAGGIVPPDPGITPE